MDARRLVFGLSVLLVGLIVPCPLQALVHRVFVSELSGNDTNACGDIKTPCKTFAGAVVQLDADGEVIVLDTGSYGKVTITQGVTIDATGVTAFIHVLSGEAITISAGSTDKVTLRGLVLNGGPNVGIAVNSVGTLNVEHCFITGFANKGISMASPGQLNLKETSVTACKSAGVAIELLSGSIRTSVDHCHFDGNATGFMTAMGSSASSTMTASNSTANGNDSLGWLCGANTFGKDVCNLEFCEASENGFSGLTASSLNSSSAARISNCVFTNNGSYGVAQVNSSAVQSRGNNTATGNGTGATLGIIGTFSPM